MAVKVPLSIRARLVWGGFAVLLIFLASAGWVVQQAFADSLRSQHLARLQITVYLLMAGAELNQAGSLIMPATLAEPRLDLPASGLYANISNPVKGEDWQSASTLGLNLPFQRSQAMGQWHLDAISTQNASFLIATYAVKWAVGDQSVPLVFSVLEDKAEFARELLAFERTLWSWLGGAGLLLLVTQSVLLRWGLTPLARVAQEVHGIEAGTQSRVEGVYPAELAGLTRNLNGLMEQERARQTRYKEALDDLAHSLKTPLAALRASLHEPAELHALVAQQVTRMDDIVQHQLGRAGASGASRFAPHLAITPILARIRDTLTKVYADKHLAFELDCPVELTWRIDEGDAFEMLGNLLDNAAKWAKGQVVIRIWIATGQLQFRVEDDGPGFAESQTGLGRRVRLDEQVPGHGIGLAVVKDLVASHQGELSIARSPLGGAQVDVFLRAL
jgi:two-component system sensor histidine kinase PhoQ